MHVSNEQAFVTAAVPSRGLVSAAVALIAQLTSLPTSCFNEPHHTKALFHLKNKATDQLHSSCIDEHHLLFLLIRYM